jgi:3-deoxy-7-phosphoheptulonate synthase
VVFRDVLQQRTNGSNEIVGMMLESHLHAGSQKASSDLSKLKYGVSITDACIDWQMTEDLLREAHRELKPNKVGAMA